MKIKEYLVSFIVKDDEDTHNFDYIIEAITKAHAIGMAFQIFFADHNNEKIEDYTVEVLINGKYEYV